MKCRPTLLVLFMALLGVLSPAMLAQPPDPGSIRTARKKFLDGLKAPHGYERVEAVETLARTGFPAALEWMGSSLEKTLRSRDRHKKHHQTLGRKIHDMTNLREWLNQPSRRPKVAALQKEQEKEATYLARDETVIDALRKGMGTIFSGLDAEGKGLALAPLIRKIRSLRKAGDRAAGVETLGHLVSASTRKILEPLVTDKEPEVRIAALEALGQQGDPSSARALAPALNDPFWQVRAAAVDALGKVGGRDAVEALVVAMDKVEGRLIQDLATALSRLTGQKYHENKVLWKSWWVKNRDTFTAPPVAARGAPRKSDTRPGKRPAGDDKAWKERTQGTTFYGIRTRSRRLVYILDISNSMNLKLGASGPQQTGRPVVHGPKGERKIDQAISELKRSITALPEDATFNIVFYNHDINVLKKGQIKASQANKKKAAAWADAIAAAGNTNIFDALERAFRLAGRGTFDPHYPVAADTFSC